MTISLSRHQFPPEIIRHAVWLYLRFTLSYRDVEDLLAKRGLEVSYETVRRRVLKFGPFAGELYYSAKSGSHDNASVREPGPVWATPGRFLRVGYQRASVRQRLMREVGGVVIAK